MDLGELELRIRGLLRELSELEAVLASVRGAVHNYPELMHVLLDFEVLLQHLIEEKYLEYDLRMILRKALVGKDERIYRVIVEDKRSGTPLEIFYFSSLAGARKCAEILERTYKLDEELFKDLRIRIAENT